MSRTFSKGWMDITCWINKRWPHYKRYWGALSERRAEIVSGLKQVPASYCCLGNGVSRDLQPSAGCPRPRRPHHPSLCTSFSLFLSHLLSFSQFPLVFSQTRTYTQACSHMYHTPTQCYTRYLSRVLQPKLKPPFIFL